MLKNALLAHLLLFLTVCALQAQVARPLEVVRQHLQQHHSDMGLTPADIAHFEVSSQVVSRHNKLTHLYLQQTHAGIPVHNGILTANIMADGKMLSVGNRFVGDLATKANTTTPIITAAGAVNAVMSHFGLGTPRDHKIVRQPNPHTFIFDHEGLALEPIRVSLVFQPSTDGTVRLAWNVDFYQLDAQHWWQARVDAVQGNLLDHHDQVIHCDFGQRGHTHSAAECTESAHAKTTTPTAGPGDGSSAYHVFPFLTESPNHGGRALLVDPYDPIASPYGWHDTDGQLGHEYTITRGNNVHAYHDIFARNESNGDEPDGGDSLCFDYPLDLSIARPYTQLDAATTNLFYWNNLMHDLWYHYGFDEQSGNFQENNYGNGGQGGDYVRAEALDGSGTDNANFSTPADGNRPRMQMYLWGGNLPTFDPPKLEVVAPESIQGEYEFVQASFGEDLPAGTPEIELVLVDDGVDVGSDACSPIINGAELTGKIALLDRGGDCQFGTKALNAQNAGAIAVIICNNSSDPIFAAGPGNDGGQVNIPTIMMSQADCNTIKMAMPGVLIQLTGSGVLIPDPGPSGRDSDFDNGVIVHEYTHGVSTRLTGGPNQSGCLTNFEQAGEGWSDWFALIMTTTSANFGEQGRGIGTYASGQVPTAGGIRPYPYSRSMSIDPHTYADINGVSVPHGVGSVWCVMIWDLFWNLVDQYGFDDDIYFGTGGNNIAMQLVMDGLKIQPCNPTFLDARDAILQADIANNNGANQCLIWETFARRGLGVNAQVEGAENFDKPNTCPPAFRVTKTGPAEAFAGDILDYELNIVNGRSNSIAEATVEDILPENATLVEGSASCNLTQTDNLLTISVGTANSGQAFTCGYALQTEAFPFTAKAFEDLVGNSQRWTFINPLNDNRWQIRIGNTYTGQLALGARNPDVITDQIMQLKNAVTLDGEKPGMMFWHYYRTEADFDGGILEISTDDGTTWTYIPAENFIENGYTTTLANSDNPLSGFMAFSGFGNGWQRVLVDLSDYAGQTVKVRFRFGTNSSNGREGWLVDDIALLSNLTTVTNTACTDNDGERLCSSVTTVLYEPQPLSNVDIAANLGFQVFPNPARNQLQVKLDTPLTTPTTLRLRTVDGKELMARTYDTFQEATVDVATFPNGIYMLELRTEQGVSTRKVVVQR